MNPIVVALVYAVVGVIVLPIILSLFKTQYEWLDVVLAAVGAAIVSLIPTIGGPISLVIMIAILYWRLNTKLFPDIIVAVGVARLTMVPALMLVNGA